MCAFHVFLRAIFRPPCYDDWLRCHVRINFSFEPISWVKQLYAKKKKRMKNEKSIFDWGGWECSANMRRQIENENPTRPEFWWELYWTKYWYNPEKMKWNTCETSAAHAHKMGNAILEQLIQCSSLRIIEIHIYFSTCKARGFLLAEIHRCCSRRVRRCEMFLINFQPPRSVEVVKGVQEQWRELYVNAQAYDTLGIWAWLFR